MRMQQVDRPAELLRQGLSLNCLPPAWWVLLGQSMTHDFAEIDIFVHLRVCV